MHVFSLVDRTTKANFLSVYEDEESIAYLPWSKRDLFCHVRLRMLLNGKYGEAIRPLNVLSFLALVTQKVDF